MANKVLSIEIGHALTKVCMLDYKAKKPRVYTCFSLETPEGMLDDGYVRPSDKFVEDFRAKCRENGVKTNKAVFSITSTKIANREVLIPFVKENRIKDVLAANSEEYFPVDISRYHLAHTVLEVVEGENKNDKQYKLLVLAAPEDLLACYTALAKSCGLNVVAIDYSGNSIYQAVKSQFQKGTNLIIKVDERSTLLTIMKDQVVMLQRTVAYGADSAIETMIDTNPFVQNLSYTEAIDILRRKTCIRKSFGDQTDVINLNSENTEDAYNSEKMARSRTEITEALRMLVTSIERVIDYYNSRNTGDGIGNMVLTGLGGDFSGLSKLLSYELGQKVTVLTNVDAPGIEKLLAKQSLSLGEYVACIGAAEAPVDFLPDRTKEKKGAGAGSRDYTVPAVMVFAGSILIAGALAATSMLSYAGAKAENDSLNAKYEKLKPIENIYAEYQGVKAEYADILEMYNATANPNDKLLEFMQELEEKMPSEITFLSFNAGTESVSMNVNVGSEEAATKVIAQLRTFESIAEVQAPSISVSTSETGSTLVSFGVTCSYAKNTEAAADEASAEAAAPETASAE